MLTIFEAAKKGDIETLKHWIEVKKLNINKRDYKGMTPWLLAVRYADIATLRWLVAHGADIRAKNAYFTALYYLVFAHAGKAAERPAKLAYLQELGIEFAHPSFALICSDEWEKLKTISHENANYLKQTDSWGCKLLHYAAAWSNQAAVEWLLQVGGASIGERNNMRCTALLLAAANGHLAVVEWLLQVGGASIGEKNTKGRRVLLAAASRGHLATVQWLLQEGGASNTEKDKEDWTALLLAAANGHLAVVQWLLQAGGASIGERNNMGWTALLLATLNGDLAMVQWLLQEGEASIKEKTKDGMSALHLAFKNKHYNTALFLLEHQADISELVVDKSFAISCSIEKLTLRSDLIAKKLQVTLQFAEALLKQEFVTALACIKEAAISVNFTLGEGNTPLHILARETAGNTYRNELISLLIKKGAHRYLLNAKAEYPIDIAEQRGDKELQDLLQTEFEKFYEDNIGISQVLMDKVLNGYLPEHGIHVVDMASRKYFLEAQFWPIILVEELHTLLSYCQMDITIFSPHQQKILENVLADFDERVAAEENSQVEYYFLTRVKELELVKLIKSLQVLNNLILKTHLQSDHALKTMSDEIWIRDSLITSYELQPLSVLNDNTEVDSVGNDNTTNANKYLITKWQPSFLAAATVVSLDLKEKENTSLEAKISSEDVNRDDEYLSFGCHR